MTCLYRNPDEEALVAVEAGLRGGPFVDVPA